MKKYSVFLLLIVFGLSGCPLTIEQQIEREKRLKEQQIEREKRLKERKERQNEIMRSWDGSHISKLIRSWGPPKEVTTDGAGGKIYIWKWGGKITIKGKGSRSQETDKKSRDTDYYYTKIVAAEPKYDRIRMFWANPEGIIYHWQWTGY